MSLRGGMVLAGFVVFSCGLGWSGDAKEQGKFEGTWKIIELIEGGRKSEDRDAVSVTFKDNTFSLVAKDKKMQGTFVVDPGKKPKTIDLNLELDGMNRVIPAIYELAGDTLKVCHPKGDSNVRPSDFNENAETVQAVLKREKK